MAVFTSQSNSIPILSVSHLLSEPVYPSQRQRQWTDIHRSEPSRRRRKAADLQTTTGRTKNPP